MGRHTTFRFALRLDATQQAAMERHAGASRWAWNAALAQVTDCLDRRAAGEELDVPWSGFDLINWINAYKRSEAAGVDDNGRPGLPWRSEICAQVFEEAAVDLGRALKAFSDSKRGLRAGRRVGFPRFKKKGRCKDSFRLRNKINKRSGRSSIRVVGRTVTVPRLGSLRVWDDTRKLRRLLARGGKICFSTIRRQGSRWYVALNVDAPELHPSLRHGVDSDSSEPLGVDVGLTDFVVAARADRAGEQRYRAPKPLYAQARKLRRASKRLSRRQRGSRRRARAARQLSNVHARIWNIRNHFLHEISNHLIETQVVVFEDLNIVGMMSNRHLARAVGDSAWGRLMHLVTYKQQWRGGTVVHADRWFPSSKLCSSCGWEAPAMPLSQRRFSCENPACALVCCRDLNAAANLAAWPRTQSQVVADKQCETENARGDSSAGATFGRRGTAVCEARTGVYAYLARLRTPEKGGVEFFDTL